jgi:RNA ligase
MTNSLSISWHSYPQVFALGHKYLQFLLTGPVTIEEKIDGSQFSFGRFGDHLRLKSKGKEIFLEAPEKMFLKAINYVVSIKETLHDGWTYRAEYLQRPKHNCLAYDRVPSNHLIIFDINTGHEEYMSYEDKVIEAKRIGLETAPLIFSGKLEDYTQFQEYLNTLSILGGQKVEGVVIKNYNVFGHDKKALLGKFVSENFKEVHQAEWKTSNTNHGDVLLMLEHKYRTPARWAKAVLHLKENGQIEGSLRDIGKLIKEVGSDIFKECEAEIMEDLKQWVTPILHRLVIRGLPEWYKKELAQSQFDKAEN